MILQRFQGGAGEGVAGNALVDQAVRIGLVVAAGKFRAGGDLAGEGYGEVYLGDGVGEAVQQLQRQDHFTAGLGQNQREFILQGESMVTGGISRQLDLDGAVSHLCGSTGAVEQNVFCLQGQGEIQLGNGTVQM